MSSRRSFRAMRCSGAGSLRSLPPLAFAAARLRALGRLRLLPGLAFRPRSGLQRTWVGAAPLLAGPRGSPHGLRPRAPRFLSGANPPIYFLPRGVVITLRGPRPRRSRASSKNRVPAACAGGDGALPPTEKFPATAGTTPSPTRCARKWRGGRALRKCGEFRGGSPHQVCDLDRGHSAPNPSSPRPTRYARKWGLRLPVSAPRCPSSVLSRSLLASCRAGLRPRLPVR